MKVVEEYQQLIDELQEKNSSKQIMKNYYDVMIGKRRGYETIYRRAFIKEIHLEQFLEDTVEGMYKQSIKMVGKFFVVFYDTPQTDESVLDVGVFQPIEGGEEITDFEMKTFPEETYISTIHYGPYDSISQAYIQLYHYAEENDCEILGEFNEKYFVDEYYANISEEFITEVFVIVAPKKS